MSTKLFILNILSFSSNIYASETRYKLRIFLEYSVQHNVRFIGDRSYHTSVLYFSTSFMALSDPFGLCLTFPSHSRVSFRGGLSQKFPRIFYSFHVILPWQTPLLTVNLLRYPFPNASLWRLEWTVWFFRKILLSKSLFTHLRKRGVVIILWTPNTFEEFRIAKEAGVDGVSCRSRCRYTKLL